MCTRNQAFEILKIVYHACDPILGHSIHDAILYGSYARGDFTAESDIDILLTADLTPEQIASQRRAVSLYGIAVRTKKKGFNVRLLPQTEQECTKFRSIFQRTVQAAG